ncbi:ethanolamine ammonia-lyase reactivating factor EutA, partial [Veillonella magna]
IEKLEPIISILVQVLANASGVGEKSIYYDLLITNHGLSNPETVSSVTFSGGVADCINDVDSSWDRYGDIGLLLGRSLKESILFKERQILKTEETIRATVVGAGSHTADVSGSTISYTEDTLPVKNIPVLRLSLEDELVNPEEMSRRIQNKLEWFVSDGELPLIALALQGEKAPSFKEIQRFAEGIALGMKPIWTMGKPLLVIIESDMAKALGNSLFTYLPEGHPIICVDSIQAKNGDYVDIGMPVAGGAVLPVIIKTLVFN